MVVQKRVINADQRQSSADDLGPSHNVPRGQVVRRAVSRRHKGRRSTEKSDSQ